MKLTRQLFAWHHWCGLIVGLFLLMMSITGSLLVFSEELEQWETNRYPEIQLEPGKPSFDASFRLVRQKYPDWEIRLYHLPQENKPLVYELRQQLNSKKVFVHPVTGQLVHIQENANQSLQRTLLLLHYTLLAGRKGTVIVFITGCLFLISLITGLIVYRKSIWKALTFRVHFNRKTSRSFYSSLHRIIGVWSLLFNLLIVATGLWLSGTIALTALTSPGIKSPQQIVTSTPLSVDAVVSYINTAYPAFEIHLVRIRPGANAVQVSGRLVSDPSYYGNYYSWLFIDGRSITIEKSQFMEKLSGTQKLKNMVGPLHFGNFGGVTLKIIYCILGLTPGFLSLSGFIVWWKRRKMRVKTQSGKKVSTVL